MIPYILTAAVLILTPYAVIAVLAGYWHNKAGMYRALWLETGRRWELVRAERDEWIITAALNAEVVNNQRQSIARLKKEVTELYAAQETK